MICPPLPYVSSLGSMKQLERCKEMYGDGETHLGHELISRHASIAASSHISCLTLQDGVRQSCWLSSLNKQLLLPSQKIQAAILTTCWKQGRQEPEEDVTFGSWHLVAVVAEYKQLLLPFFVFLWQCHTRVAWDVNCQRVDLACVFLTHLHIEIYTRPSETSIKLGH